MPGLHFTAHVVIYRRLRVDETLQVIGVGHPRQVTLGVI